MNSPAEDEKQNYGGYEENCCGGKAFQDRGSHDGLRGKRPHVSFLMIP
jgi:hypothetical protein